jgi:hypothetical protein
VTYLRTWGEHRVYFHREGQHLVSVPASWTDVVAVDPVVQLAAGRALFRARDLLELAQLMEGLRRGVNANIKLASVATDPLGASGRTMLQAMWQEKRTRRNRPRCPRDCCGTKSRN